MAGYDDIDWLLGPWADRRKIKVERERLPPFRRFFHRSGRTPPHTFQVVIEPEINGTHRTDVHLIEGPEECEIHKMWQLNASNFEAGMNDIERFMRDFFA